MGVIPYKKWKYQPKNNILLKSSLGY